MNVGLVGNGAFGPNIYRNLCKFDFINSITVCDTSIEALKNLQRIDSKEVITTQDINIILNDKDIEIVFIATPIRTHYSLAQKCLSFGKHVFLEKPMAFTPEEGEKLIFEAQQRKKLLHIDNIYLYSAEVAFLKQCLTFDVLGKPLYFRSTRLNRGPFLTNTTVLEDLLCHDVSIIHYLFPEKKFNKVSVTGKANLNKGAFDDANITLFTDHDFVAYVHVSWIYPEKRREITIGGTNSLIYHNSSKPDNKPFTVNLKTGSIKNYETITNLGEPLYVELNHFFERLSRNETTLSNADEGLKIIKVLEAAQKSLILQGTPVNIEV